MAKMNLPELEQIDLIEQRCNEIEEKYPHRRAAYQPSFANFDSELRQGIVMYRPGWGWRLRIGWRETLEEKRRQIIIKQPFNLCPECHNNADEALPDRVHVVGDQFICCDWTILITKNAAQQVAQRDLLPGG